MGQFKVPVKTPDGPRLMTLFQALYFRIWMDAVSGKVSQQKLLVKLLPEALAANVTHDQALRQFDAFVLNYEDVGSKDPMIRAFVQSLAKRSRRT